MRNTSRLLKHGIVLSLLTSTLLHATNGDNLIAVGAKSRAMGGTGIAMAHGSESALSNPAMITGGEGVEFAFGGSLFNANMASQIKLVPPLNQDRYKSAADLNMIPEVSLSYKIDDNWHVGAGMFGVAGMGVDYRNAKPNLVGISNFQMVTNLQLLQFAVPIAYKTGGLSLAIAPILMYGNLDINYGLPIMGTAGGLLPFTLNMGGGGLSQDFGFGFNLGAGYDFDNGVVVGAMYKSSIEMTYANQISEATRPFALFHLPEVLSDTLEQPAEYGIGISYAIDEHTFAFDYKRTLWSSTIGYGDFGWEDQDVFAFGYQYTQEGWAMRAGVNYGASVVVEQDGSTAEGAALNFLNLMGFPATAELHWTMGGTYEITENIAVDLAFTYATNTYEEFDVSGLLGDTLGQLDYMALGTDHQENTLTFALRFNY